jgi:hypothetical protein
MGIIGCGDLNLAKNEAGVYHGQVRTYSRSGCIFRAFAFIARRSGKNGSIQMSIWTSPPAWIKYAQFLNTLKTAI